MNPNSQRITFSLRLILFMPKLPTLNKKINAIIKEKKLRLGVGAYCSVFTKYLHSKPIIAKKYPNYTATDKVHDLNCIKKEVRKVNRKEQMCAIFTHKDFDDVKVYCVLRFAVVTKEGPESDIFPTEKEKATRTSAVTTDHLLDQIEVP